MRVRATKIFSFEMAHALLGHDGSCKNIHGHSYRLLVTVIGEVNTEKSSPKSGMVIDFTDLKNIVDTHIIKKFDHSLVLNQDHYTHLSEIRPELENVIKVEYQPTCENLVSEFNRIISRELPHGIKLHHLKLYETPTSYAEWHAEDN